MRMETETETETRIETNSACVYGRERDRETERERQRQRQILMLSTQLTLSILTRVACCVTDNASQYFLNRCGPISCCHVFCSHVAKTQAQKKDV
jgi:hypothetical protein